MFSSDRQTHRRAFVDAWAKARSGQPLDPVEAQIVQIVRMHPQYQNALTDPDRVLQRDFVPALGDDNPFLHMGLHIAILEQLSTDRPVGIRRLHQTLTAVTGDPHTAEHRLMDCLAAGLWRVQHDRKPFDDKDYFECIQHAASRR